MNKYLVCVDSDGCAMDTMTIKHVRCFGPCLVTVWKLEQWEQEILKRWNDINLYTKKRGINRFQGLSLMLGEVDAQYTKIPGIETLKEWVETTPAFSEANLKKEIEANPNCEALNKALEWSQLVNRGIQEIPDEEKIAFSGVKEALQKIKESADLAIVSSANREAMEEEWQRCGLMEYVDYSMAQDVGTKEACIRSMIEKGYGPACILMVGDAPGDRRAAEGAGVWYYPILAGKEEESWKRFRERILQEFVSGAYGKERQAEEIQAFEENLKEE